MNSPDRQIRLYDTYGALCIGGADFLFDLIDLPTIEDFDWRQDKDGYLVSGYVHAGRRRLIRFHRVIMNARPGQIVDHINRNRADNRRHNLRCCTRCENESNRGLFSSNTSGVTGVHFDSVRGKWAANITYQGRRIFIGRFDSMDEAVMARLDKEGELFQDFAPQRSLYDELALSQFGEEISFYDEEADLPTARSWDNA